MSIQPDKPRRSPPDATESWAGDASLVGDREPLEVLADEFTRRCRDGEHPSIEEYAERCPELAEEIHDLFPTIAAMEQLKVGKERSAGGQASLRGVQLERLGDYRIIREIGRGGMGIVYDAEQESLGRRVAVKVLPKQALLDEKHLKRFQREARTAARLHHTNIVPVFGVGHDDGYHYYVMQLIDGAGLDRCGRLGFAAGHFDETRVARSDTTPDPIGPAIFMDNPSSSTGVLVAKPETRRPNARIIARIGIQAADALDYAHRHGVLHRDIKPANLILDSHGTVWVTDFGLAKVLEQENVTRSGDVVGTLRYMAPEHLTGVQVDARSDIYSLGITLYELLTGQPAFGDLPHGRMVEKIVDGDIARPRQLNQAIPRDLETVVLTAITCEPEDRYQSAGDLVEDLRRFLADKPLLARRTTALEHFWRWCRRNRLVASLAATALMLLVLVAVTTTAGLVRTKAALDGETAERERAEDATDLALDLLDKIYEQFAPPPFDPFAVMAGADADFDSSLRPALSPDTAALLENMLDFYDRLAGQSGDDERVRRKAAQASRRMGDIRRHLGQFDEAVDAYGRAIDNYAELYEASGDAKLALATARIHNELGLAYPRMGQPEEAGHSHQQAIKILESVLPEDSVPEFRYELARSYYFLARAHHWDLVPPAHAASPGLAQGPREWDDAPPRGRHPPESHLRPADPPRDHVLGAQRPDWDHGPPKHYRGQEAKLAHSEEGRQQRELYLRKAISLLEDLLREPTHPQDHAALLAYVYHALGTLQKCAERRDEATASFGKAVSVQSTLAERFPEVATHHVLLGWLQQPLADLLIDAGQVERARRLLESSRDILCTQLEADSSMLYLHGPLANAYDGLEEVYRQLGEDELAEKANRDAEQYRRPMHHGPPGPFGGKPKGFGPGKYHHRKPAGSDW